MIPVDPNEWSQSALWLVQDCGEAYRRRYLLKERYPSSIRQIRGTVIHAVSHAALARKLSADALPSTEEARDLAADQFDRLLKEGVSYEPEDVAEGIDTVNGRSKDFSIGLSAFHVESVAPTIRPVAVERRITVKPKDSDLTISGKIDLIDASPFGETIRDLKTSEKSPRKDQAEVSQQLTMYAMLRWAEVGTLPRLLALDYLVQTPKDKRESYVPMLTRRSPDDVQSLVNRLNMATEAVKKGVFVPANPDSWRCSPRYCEFYSSCPYVRRSRRPTS